MVWFCCLWSSHTVVQESMLPSFWQVPAAVTASLLLCWSEWHPEWLWSWHLTSTLTKTFHFMIRIVNQMWTVILYLAWCIDNKNSSVKLIKGKSTWQYLKLINDKKGYINFIKISTIFCPYYENVSLINIYILLWEFDY